MKTEWLNDGQPFPEGHRKAGQVGMVIDFEDGRPEPLQHVYADTPSGMTLKIAQMYGNTNIRLAEVKTATPKPAAPPTAVETPAAAPVMTADERMQAVADLADPERAPAAIKKLLKVEGLDLDANKKAEADKQEEARLTGETTKFVSETPEWYGTAKNARLLRDRTFARVGAHFSAKDLHESFIELQEMQVLDSDQSQQETTSEPEEPLAPPPVKTVSTGARPSQTGNRSGALPVGGQPLTLAYIQSIAGTDEYLRRLRDEPGFQARVDAALS